MFKSYSEVKDTSGIIISFSATRDFEKICPQGVLAWFDQELAMYGAQLEVREIASAIWKEMEGIRAARFVIFECTRSHGRKILTAQRTNFEHHRM